MAPSILTEVDGGVGIITLNRPERDNALDDAMVAELLHALDGMAGDESVRVVVLSGAGRSFCAGGGTGGEAADAQTAAEMLAGLARLPKPTVARVQGPAGGAGVGLVAACDIAIAAFDAWFALVGPDVCPHVAAAMGERHARRYRLTAERFSAAEAYRIGLIHEMAADEAALDEAVGQIVDAVLGNPSA
ncbi:MAG: enoyl-CoA hydratase-related protein [Rhodocyclaceae bacterium]|nr:enoyl-CoA hydratase-related protein [Rhodocyclaceae bacterium]